MSLALVICIFASTTRRVWDVELQPGETLEVKTSGNVTVA